MIPKSRNWKVTFYLYPDYAAQIGRGKDNKLSIVILCVKRFAKSIANEQLGYPAYNSYKVTVGLVR